MHNQPTNGSTNQPTDHVHMDMVARIGHYLAWECQTCHRVEATDIDLTARVSTIVGA